ncbi:MAG: alpha/beta hydrolase family esterase [Fimbriiglobus sp.]
MRHAFLLFSLLLTPLTFAADAEGKKANWKVGGDNRNALIFAPEKASKEPAPLVFCWHGHGGTMGLSAKAFAFHKVWPEAIVVYPQGLNTPVPLVDKEGKRSGWQTRVGDQEDRDLKFFDAMLQTVKKDYMVDGKRVYSTGHSNGGVFTYVLWAARGDKLAAVAPSAAIPSIDFKNAKPKPVFHVAGEKDDLVKFEWQKSTINTLKKLNGVEAEGKELSKYCTEYTSKSGPPVVAFIHPEGHSRPPQEAITGIAEFFKAHAAK